MGISKFIPSTKSEEEAYHMGVDQEQFNHIEKLVEGVETDDLPTRLRTLAEELEKACPLLKKYAPYKGEEFISNPEAETVNMLNRAANRIAAELEKES